MDIHRKGKSGCEVLIDHFTNACPNSSFSVQILEVLIFSLALTLKTALIPYKHLDQLNKREVKKMISDIVDELPSCSDDRLRWYEYALDIINTK